MKENLQGIYVTLDELVRLGQKAKGFSFLPKANIHSILSGRHGSKFRGRGMDFSELRQYTQGDDTRQIDWKVTQRTGKAYLRLYNEERDRSVWLILSQRNSMFFGSGDAMKSVQAAHAAALGAFRVLSSGDRIGGVVFNDEKVVSFKPQKSQKALMLMLNEIVEQNQDLHVNNSTNNVEQFNRALKLVTASAKHDDLIVLIGDGQGFNDETASYLSRLSKHNDILAMMIYDKREEELIDSGTLLFSDGKNFVDINSSKKTVQKQFLNSFEAHLTELNAMSRKHNTVFMKLSTDEEVLTQVQRQLGFSRKPKRGEK